MRRCSWLLSLFASPLTLRIVLCWVSAALAGCASRAPFTVSANSPLALARLPPRGSGRARESHQRLSILRTSGQTLRRRWASGQYSIYVELWPHGRTSVTSLHMVGRDVGGQGTQGSSKLVGRDWSVVRWMPLPVWRLRVPFDTAKFGELRSNGGFLVLIASRACSDSVKALREPFKVF